MGALAPLALSLAPELARALFGSNAENTTAAIAEAVKAATGTSDPEEAAAKLQQDPAAANQLRVQFARIAAEHDEASGAASLDRVATSLREASATRPTATAAPQAVSIAWSAPLISLVVLATFGAVMGLILLKGLPAGAETAANMLLGTLAAMATSVVSYWVGSSAGSARKDDRLAQAGK